MQIPVNDVNFHAENLQNIFMLYPNFSPHLSLLQLQLTKHRLELISRFVAFLSLRILNQEKWFHFDL